MTPLDIQTLSILPMAKKALFESGVADFCIEILLDFCKKQRDNLVVVPVEEFDVFINMVINMLEIAFSISGQRKHFQCSIIVYAILKCRDILLSKCQAQQAIKNIMRNTSFFGTGLFGDVPKKTEDIIAARAATQDEPLSLQSLGTLLTKNSNYTTTQE